MRQMKKWRKLLTALLVVALMFSTFDPILAHFAFEAAVEEEGGEEAETRPPVEVTTAESSKNAIGEEAFAC